MKHPLRFVALGQVVLSFASASSATESRVDSWNSNAAVANGAYTQLAAADSAVTKKQAAAQTAISTPAQFDAYLDMALSGRMSAPNTSNSSDILTCGLDFLSVPHATHSISAQGDYAGVRIGFSSRLGGIGTSFQLINPRNSGSPVDILEGRSAAGGGWQFSSVAWPVGSTQPIFSNQSAGNSHDEQHGFDAKLRKNSSSDGAQWLSSSWTPHFTQRDNGVKSPCPPFGDSKSLYEEALNVSILPVQIGQGTVVSLRHQISLNPLSDSQWAKWSGIDALYLSLSVAAQNNMRVYAGNLAKGWNAGPIYPWKSDYDSSSFVDKSGSKRELVNYNLEGKMIKKHLAGADYFVLIWNIYGQDIAVVNYDLRWGGSLIKQQGWPYCRQIDNPSCGAFALYSSSAYYPNGVYFQTGKVRTYTSKYIIGSPQQIQSLGFRAE